MSGAIRRWMLLAGLAAAPAWAQLLVVTCLPGTLPTWVGSSVSVTCLAVGGIPPYTWSIAAGGALPGGLTQDPNSGNITGTLTGPAGPYSFTVVATDSSSPANTGTQNYSGSLINALACIPAAPAGPVEVGVLYMASCTVTGGTPPYSWTIGGNAVPPGMAVDANGNIAYTPTAPMAAYQYHIDVSDSSLPPMTGKSAVYSGAIAPAVTILTTSPLPAAAVGSVYNLTFTGSGGVAPYAWSISGQPTWLTLNGAVLSGTPPATGPVTFNITLTDAAGGTTGSVPFTLPVNAALAISPPSPLPAASIGKLYTQTFTATGGSGAGYSWSISSQPSWLTMTTAGVLSGTPPTGTTNASFTVTVVDSSGNSSSVPYVLPIALAITTVSPLPAATIGTLYSQTFAAGGGAGGYTWTVSGQPTWLSMSTAGVLSGTPPTTAVDATFTVTVTDSAKATASGPFTVPVNITITTTSPLPTATIGTAYSQTFAAEGGAGGYTWAVSGQPTWLSMTTAGVLSGSVPTTALNATFTVTATDSATVKASGSFTVPVALAITTVSPLPTATSGTQYTQTLSAEGGAGGYKWGGTNLPSWLTLTSAGVLQGTPPAGADNVTFTATVTDSANVSTSASLTVPVTLAISTTSLEGGAVGAPYSQTLAGTGGAPPYTWSVIAGALPNNLQLNGSSGVINGTPTAAGNFTFTIQLNDSSTAHVSAQFTIAIASGLTITTAPTLPNATVGTAYSDTLTAAGGTSPYTWAVTLGSLPSPLTLNQSTGAITGTPAAPGTSTFTVQVTDHVGVTATKQFSLTVAAQLVITTTSLPNGSVGLAYSQTLAGAGGTPPYAWSVSGGALPNSLQLNGSTGVINGTPTAAGTFAFTIQLNDSASGHVTAPFTIVIASGLTITNAPTLPNATVGAAYTVTLAAVGGTTPYAWAITQGSLPSPLTLNPSSGAIAGTPAAVGTATFTVQVTDHAGLTASKQFTLTVAGQLTITTTTLANGSVGLPYSQTLAATGGTPPYSWSITVGAPPPGTTLNSSGLLSGTPTSFGTFQFTVQATDNASISVTKTLGVTIASGLTITTAPTLPTGSVGILYSETFAASGGTQPYTWSLASGSLPLNFGLSPAGVFAGVASNPVNATFTIKVTDSSRPVPATATKTFTLSIVSGLAVSTPSPLPSGEVGATYAQTLAAVGGTAPYTWSVVEGSLPPPLTLSPSGAVTGSPNAPGTYNFTAEVKDSNSKTASKAFGLTIAGPLTITTPATLPNGAVGDNYSQALAASGGAPPYTWTLTTGHLPTGVTLTGSSLIGTPTPSAAGSFTFTLQVTDSASATVSKQFSLKVVVGPTISTTATLPAGNIGLAYAETLAATGGAPPYTWAVSAGALPSGVSLGTNGAITGTPAKAGTFTFTVQVTDSASASSSQQFTLVIGSSLVVSTTSPLPGGSAGKPYSLTLAAAGGSPPYTWAITQGSLPAQLALNTTSGVISGTPAAPGTATFTVQVTDNAAAKATAQVTLVIGAGVSITTSATLPAAIAGTAYAPAPLAASGGTAPYTWVITTGGLAPGLTLSPAGVITGTPTAAGNFSATIAVTDSVSATATRQFTLSVTLPGPPAATFSGISATANPVEQLTPGLKLAAAEAFDVSGTVTISFNPQAVNKADDPAIQFSTGSRVASLTIPHGQTAVQLPPLQTGTVTGTITLTVVWVGEQNNLTQNIQIPAGAPVITAVTASSTSGGFQIQVTGYSTTREVSQASVQFTPAAGQTLQTTSATVSLTSASSAWFQGSTSAQYGSQFVLTLPFTVSNGGASAIASVSVQLVNTQGTSNSMSATLP